MVAFASTAIATLVWLPVGVAQAPSADARLEDDRSVVALGVPGTALAYLLFFGLITGAGAAYASLVTYLIPPIALAYGAIFLGERFGVCGLRRPRADPGRRRAGNRRAVTRILRSWRTREIAGYVTSLSESPTRCRRT